MLSLRLILTVFCYYRLYSSGGGDSCTNGDTQIPQDGDDLMLMFEDMDQLIEHLGQSTVPNCNWDSIKVAMCEDEGWETVELRCFGLDKMIAPIKPRKFQAFPLMLNCNEQVMLFSTVSNNKFTFRIESL